MLRGILLTETNTWLKGELKHEFWTKLIQLVFKQCTIPCIAGNRSHWTILGIQKRIFKTYRIFNYRSDCSRFGIQRRWCERRTLTTIQPDYRCIGGKHMEEMRIYIANLGKYNEGELVGAWFSVPVDIEEVKERIELDAEYEEYAIHDYELPFDVGEFTPIWDINATCEMIRQLEGSPVFDELREIQRTWFNSMEELLDNVDEITCYSDCDSMEDVARYYVEETGQLGEIPSNLQNYIDYQALGRDMELEGNFLITSNGVFEYRN